MYPAWQTRSRLTDAWAANIHLHNVRARSRKVVIVEDMKVTLLWLIETANSRNAWVSSGSCPWHDRGPRPAPGRERHVHTTDLWTRALPDDTQHALLGNLGEHTEDHPPMAFRALLLR